MPNLKLGHLELFVHDPARSRDFYRDILGFEVISEQGESFIWLRSNDREILLRRSEFSNEAAVYKEAAIAFVLYTDDLPAMLNELMQKGLLPRGNDGSSKCPTFTDPDGHWFQIVNPQDH
ncbi:MAG TPA: VOC family protein [Tepidisphaeraceae bacterium]|jgi:catechol 2,3-dioxygenase-like lactoylglutathione lyase family enzyme|nr:VOC family protein [Tepidisphaeraceae bacterium]